MSNKIVNYPGHEITTNEIKRGKVLESVQNFKPTYNWAAGVAISKYLEGLKMGKLIGRKCNQCQRVLVPPRMYCEQCFRPTDEWVELKDTGTINTFSISHVAADASRTKEPLVVAVIEIDGASPGMGILHHMGEVEPDPEKVKVGMKVKAVWKPRDQRDGSITDIRYFKPLGET